MNKPRLVIVGGGTAGWMAAGYLVKYFSDWDISLVESATIPRIGVGESVTPHVASFFDEIGVDRHHWMKHTAAVYKYANKFVDWKTGEGETEYFSFTYTSEAKELYKDIDRVTTMDQFTNDPSKIRTTDCLLNMDIDRFDKYFNPQFHYMENNTAPFDGETDLLNAFLSSSQHINAEMAADYIREFIAIPQGVRWIRGTVNDIQHEGNEVSKILLADGTEIEADVFIDASGFHKVIVSKLGWNEILQKDNPIDRAWVCQTEYVDQENEMVNYTQSIAEPNGWRFKIGLYHRMGNGYCFSSKHETDEGALDHFVKVAGLQRTAPRLIKWQPKRLEKMGQGNVSAIGLSCGFTEPLEANALYTIITSIRRLAVVLSDYRETGKLEWDTYNEKMSYTIDDIAKFILVHYTLSSRRDTQFWRDMAELGERENHRALMLEKYNHINNTMKAAVTGYTLFPEYMWAQLATHLGLDMSEWRREIDPVTQRLAELRYTHSEEKNRIISSTRQNNFEWHKQHVFDNMSPKEWEQKFIK